MLIDTHAHVNFRSFQDDAKETLQRALDSGVQVITVGSQIGTSRHGVELANMFASGVYAAVGLHPEHTHSQMVDEEDTHFKTREEVFDYDLYRELAKDPKVVGIGECGLDYYRMPLSGEGSPLEEGSPLAKAIKEKQKAAFRLQIKLAKELNKALVVHSRPAKDSNELYEDMLAIIDEGLNLSAPRLATSGHLPSGGENSVNIRDDSKTAELLPLAEGEVPRPEGVGDLRFEIHSFTGTPDYLQKFLDRGAYVSFNGIVTFDKTGNMEKLVKMTPLDRLILETDCPYLTPVPNRGKRNEPSFIKFTAEKVAQLKSMPLEEISKITTENARKLFNI